MAGALQAAHRPAAGTVPPRRREPARCALAPRVPADRRAADLGVLVPGLPLDRRGRRRAVPARDGHGVHRAGRPGPQPRCSRGSSGSRRSWGRARVMIVETLVAGVLLAIRGHPRRAVSVAVLVLTGVGLSTAAQGRDRASAPAGRPRRSSALPGLGELPVRARARGGAAVRDARPHAGGVPRAQGRARVGHDRDRTYRRADRPIARLPRRPLLQRRARLVAARSALLAAWAAAVLVWGRSRPPLAERPVHPCGRLWWRCGDRRGRRASRSWPPSSRRCRSNRFGSAEPARPLAAA